MAVVFTILYHARVVREDIPALSLSTKRALRRAIEEKLMIAPEIYGKPLRQSLRGYRKLRLGDYRVIFCIKGSTVYVLAILHRSIVYKHAPKRAGR